MQLSSDDILSLKVAGTHSFYLTILLPVSSGLRPDLLDTVRGLLPGPLYIILFLDLTGGCPESPSSKSSALGDSGESHICTPAFQELVANGSLSGAQVNSGA